MYLIVAPLYFVFALCHVLYHQPKRIAYIASGYLIVPFLNAWCVWKGLDEYPKWAYYWGAYEEDGLDGDRLGWYSKHLGYSFKGLSKWEKYVLTMRWWHRNSCFNLRWHPTVGINVQNAKVTDFKGNTYHHGQRYSFEPLKNNTKWHNITFDIDGTKRTTSFFYIKLFGDYRLYLRWGLKMYPAYYLDPWWVAKISKEGWPDYKDTGVYIGMIRLEKYSEEFK